MIGLQGASATSPVESGESIEAYRKLTSYGML